MNYDELMRVLEPLDGSMEVFVASTVLMPLGEMYMCDELTHNELIMVQNKEPYKSNNGPVTVQELRGFLGDYNNNDTIMLLSAFPRPLETAEVKTVGDMKKSGSNRSVSVEEVWDLHPVQEDTVREVLILFTPL